MSIVLEADELRVYRGRVCVLADVSFALHAGEALALVGPNAAGKSTLVRALAGLLPVAHGAVRLQGRCLAGWARDALARTVALVTSEEEGPTLLTVRERVVLGRYPHRGPFRRMGADDDAAVAQALEETGIAALADRQIGRLSAGERQLSRWRVGWRSSRVCCCWTSQRRTSTSAINCGSSGSWMRSAAAAWQYWP